MKKHKKARFEDFDDDENQVGRDTKQRRPIRNWTKMYVEHVDEIDEYDDFHKYRIKS